MYILEVLKAEPGLTLVSRGSVHNMLWSWRSNGDLDLANDGGNFNCSYSGFVTAEIRILVFQ